MSFRKFLEKNQKQFLEALRDGAITIDEAANSIAAEKRSQGYEIVLYELLSACKKRNYDNFNVFLPLLRTDNEHCRQMVFKEHIHFEFPVVNNNQAEMARGIVVETDRLFTNVHNVFSHIEKLSKIVGKNFSVLFDRDIVEDSFMLPLYIALSLKDYDRRWVFTGGLEESLDIRYSDFLEEKEKACKSLCKILLSAREFSNVRQIVEFLSSERYNVPFVISFTDKRDEEYLKRSYEKLC
ncbi:MAG: hypothetical protein WHT65_10365, partial [Pseudothermotoga sp.]